MPSSRSWYAAPPDLRRVKRRIGTRATMTSPACSRAPPFEPRSEMKVCVKRRLSRQTTAFSPHPRYYPNRLKNGLFAAVAAGAEPWGRSWTCLLMGQLRTATRAGHASAGAPLLHRLEVAARAFGGSGCALTNGLPQGPFACRSLAKYRRSRARAVQTSRRPGGEHPAEKIRSPRLKRVSSTSTKASVCEWFP